MRPLVRMLLAGGLVALAAGCPDKSGPTPAVPVAPGSSSKPEAETTKPTSGAPAAAPAGNVTPPPVARQPIPEWPLESPVDRGAKPEVAPALLEKGKQLFAANCATCHGPEGKGDGPAAFFAQPRPRNFTKGIFKLHTNDNGSLPLDEDLFDTITRGMGGTAMPAFEKLPAEDRWALVQYVKELAVFRDPEEDPPVEVHFFKERPAGPQLAVGEPRPASPALLATGKTAYLKLDCNKCHGPQGDGNGPSATDLKDDWGEEIWPRNFQEGRYRYVHSIRDIGHRVNTGLSGTPMAAFGASQLTDDERWALGHFLASLRKGEPKAEAPKDGLLVASKNAQPQPIPTNLRQARFWLDVPLYEVALQGDGPKTARVAVQRDAKNLAIVVSWDDAIAKDRPAAVEDFLDSVVLHLGTSDIEWKGEWQKDPNRSPLEERGPQAQKLEGSGKWTEGEWKVLFVRPLAGLEGKTLDLTIKVEDRSPSGAKTSSSGALKLAVPQ